MTFRSLRAPTAKFSCPSSFQILMLLPESVSHDEEPLIVRTSPMIMMKPCSLEALVRSNHKKQSHVVGVLRQWLHSEARSRHLWFQGALARRLLLRTAAADVRACFASADFTPKNRKERSIIRALCMIIGKRMTTLAKFLGKDSACVFR